MTLAPSVVRKIILDEHELIKKKLEAIEALLGKKQDQALKNAVDEFGHYFLKHLATEEKYLRPALTTIDAWGPVRAEQLAQEHIEQTRELKRLSSLVQEKRFAEYEKEIKLFVQAVYKDIEQENKDFLNADVLKDDLITAGNCG